MQYGDPSIFRVELSVYPVYMSRPSLRLRPGILPLNRVSIRKVSSVDKLYRSGLPATLVAVSLALQVFGLVLLIEKPAHAYVDPGSGLLNLQILGASLAGGVFYLRHKL